MKKIIAMLAALTTVFCAFTACGNDKEEDDKAKDKDDKEIVTEAPEEEEEAEKETEAEEKEPEEETEPEEEEETEPEEESEEEDKETSGTIEISSKEEDAYIALVTNLFTAAKDKDYDKALEYIFPAEVCKTLNDWGYSYDNFAGEYGDVLSTEDAEPEELVVAAVRPASDEEIQFVAIYNSFINAMYDAYNKAGIDPGDLASMNMPNDEQNKIIEEALAPFESMESGDFSGVSNDVVNVKMDDCVIVTFNVDGEDEDMFIYKSSKGDLRLDIISYSMYQLFSSFGG